MWETKTMQSKLLHLILLSFSISIATVSSPSAKEVFIDHKDLTLSAHLNLSSKKKLEDGVILLLHGTLAHNNMETIKNLASVLNERGFNTFSINLSLGINKRRGMYDCSVPHRHKHLDALDEIAAWVKWLSSKNVKNIILLGHSRGGNQVTRFATQIKNTSIRKLILLAPATWNQGSAEIAFENRHKQPLNGILAKAEKLIKKGNGKKIMPETGILSCPKADVTAASFVSYYRPNPRRDTPSILKELKIPTLIIAGGKDTIVKDLIKKVKKLTNEHTLQLAIIDDADHFFLDLFAEDVADLIEEFTSP